MNVNILIADDHRIMREGLRALLEKQNDFEVIAEAGDGRTAVRLSRELSPDIVIMDISMPELNGIEATRMIITKNPHTKVIALSMLSSNNFAIEMFKAGCSAYILKDCAWEELVYAIHTVLNGQIYLSPVMATSFMKDFLQKSGKETPLSAFSILTNREREVLQLFAEGKSTKEIAALLQVSPKTIETQRQSIFSKLNIKSVAELTRYAIREGLISP
ncbi:MAG: response regulator transcription factor [Nitrospirae bacterium]|nr:response regulator transcription factor [Nitrospirota bacterium]